MPLNQSGTYHFCIKNDNDTDIVYDIKFSDKMNLFVNMKYKLKLDNVYVRGTEKNYVGINELDINEITVLKGSNNIYTLEWYWEDNDALDTTVGIQEEQYYTLNLEIEAREYHR
ncbi:MAG: hypothetical protein IJ777_00550 [Clostridia bacterium]|nr:hypothetical protein [Clostridia bacterium]